MNATSISTTESGNRDELCCQPRTKGKVIIAPTGPHPIEAIHGSQHQVIQINVVPVRLIDEIAGHLNNYVPGLRRPANAKPPKVTKAVAPPKIMSQDLDPLRPLSEIFEPDIRQPHLVGTLEDLHAWLSSLILHHDVPLDIQQMFETAKNARLYTYFVYRFHQVTEMLAYQTLERALRTRWIAEVANHPSTDDEDQKWPGLAWLIKYAGSKNWIRSEGFSRRERLAWKSLRDENTLAIIEQMQKGESAAANSTVFQPTQTQIDERTEQIDMVELLASCVPHLRNALAHGSARLSPSSDSVLQDVCDVINMAFQRHTDSA